MPKTMTLEQCAARMTAFLAHQPRKGKTRAYIATLPKRPPIVVTTTDYPISKAQAREQDMQAERDAQRYAAWEARGKPPSPTIARKTRLRPKARLGNSASGTLLHRIAEAQAMRCAGCGHALDFDLELNDPMQPSVDHVWPRSAGGKDADNRLAMHRRCNEAKSDRMPNGCERVMLIAVNARLDPTPAIRIE